MDRGIRVVALRQISRRAAPRAWSVGTRSADGVPWRQPAPRNGGRARRPVVAIDRFHASGVPPDLGTPLAHGRSIGDYLEVYLRRTQRKNVDGSVVRYV